MTTPVSTLVIRGALAAAVLAIGANAFAGEPVVSARDPAPMRVQDKGTEPGAAKKPEGPKPEAPKPEAPKPAQALNTIAEVFAALEACWMPPALDQARPGMQITVMVSFKRSGELLGKPRITYETPGATDEERLAYRVAMAQALERCMPLRFTDALGNALAGRPMTLRFIDNRKLKQAGTGHDRES
jgi:hypothetical protein